MAANKTYHGHKMTRLHVFLTEAFPLRATSAHNVLNVPWLAKKIKKTPQTVYNWIRYNKLPIEGARAIAAIPECEFALEDFLDFLG